MSAATTGGQPHSTFVPGKAASTAGKKLEVHDLNNMLSIYIFFVSVCILGIVITDKILQCIYSMITSLWHAVTAIYTQSGYYPVFLYHSSMRLTYPVFFEQLLKSGLITSQIRWLLPHTGLINTSWN